MERVPTLRGLLTGAMNDRSEEASMQKGWADVTVDMGNCFLVQRRSALGSLEFR